MNCSWLTAKTISVRKVYKYNLGVFDCNDIESVVSHNEKFVLYYYLYFSLYNLGLDRMNISGK